MKTIHPYPGGVKKENFVNAGKRGIRKGYEEGMEKIKGILRKKEGILASGLWDIINAGQKGKAMLNF